MSLLAESTPADPVKWLARTKTLLLADTDDDEIASPEIAALKWIAYETRVGDTLFFFHDGRWFAVDDDYSRTVRAEANRILGTAASVTLPAWTDQPEEKDYNAYVAKQDPRYLLMDRKKIHTKMHRYGIEACDLLGPADEFIHVKRLRGSDDASHLFAQALVATDALLLDPEARQKLADRVHQQSGGERLAPETPKTVVLAIAGRGRLDANSLFTFSQVTLVRLQQQLYLRGIAVRVIAIPE